MGWPVPRSGEGELLPEIASYESVKYAAYTTGPFSAFVKVTVEDKESLHALRQQGLMGFSAVTETAVLVMAGPFSPRIGEPNPERPLEAFVLVKTDRGRALDVLVSTSAVDGGVGSGIVAGSFDVLLVVQAADLDEMAQLVLGQLQQVDGIVSTQTALVLSVAAGNLEEQEASAT